MEDADCEKVHVQQQLVVSNLTNSCHVQEGEVEQTATVP